MAEEYTPKTIEDCIIILDEILTEEQKTEITEMTADEFETSAHFGLGMWIRNNFGAWNEDAPLPKNIGHSGDNLSAIILEAYYKHLTS